MKIQQEVININLFNITVTTIYGNLISQIE